MVANSARCTKHIALQNVTKERKDMSDYTEEQLDQIWKKGFVAGDLDPEVYRTDAANALMKRDLYGNEGNLGWEVDHIYPKDKLKAKGVPKNMWDDMVNLRPMNAKNNVAKGEDYPAYTRVVVWDKQYPKLHRNVTVSGDAAKRKVNDSIQAEVFEHYKKWLQCDSRPHGDNDKKNNQ